MTLTEPEIRALMALAARATAGPWEAAEWYGSDDGGWAARGPHHDQPDGSDEPDCDAHEAAKRDAAFIAAAYPVQVTALCEALLALRADLERARGLLRAMVNDGLGGDGKCNMCEEWNQCRRCGSTTVVCPTCEARAFLAEGEK